MSARLFPASPALAIEQVQVRGSFWLDHLASFWRAYQTRQHLAALDEHMLRDVGLTPGQARREVDRKPWDIQQGC
ncbi:DUF1127 domain-containing protein [Roseococcus sp. YIM B11640]|uniref:DUF1127 domain-containing protein n=1 Tax=Roseococcus sp. YIM B11640 TaxID=3133973 RepID=UPI003C7C2F66